MNVTQTLGYRMHTDNICVFIMRAFCSVMNIDDIVEIIRMPRLRNEDTTTILALLFNDSIHLA